MSRMAWRVSSVSTSGSTCRNVLAAGLERRHAVGREQPVGRVVGPERAAGPGRRSRSSDHARHPCPPGQIVGPPSVEPGAGARPRRADAPPFRLGAIVAAGPDAPSGIGGDVRMSLVEISTPQPRTRVITLNRPERLNAMSIELVIELAAAFETCAADNDCSVVDPHRGGPGVLLGARPQGLRHHPEHRRPPGRPDRPAVDALLLLPGPDHAADAPAGDRRGQRHRLRRRHVPVAGRRAAHRLATRPSSTAPASSTG